MYHLYTAADAAGIKKVLDTLTAKRQRLVKLTADPAGTWLIVSEDRPSTPGAPPRSQNIERRPA